MNKLLYIAIVTVCIIACNEKQQNGHGKEGQKSESKQSDSTKLDSIVLDGNLPKPKADVAPWVKPPYYMDSTASYYCYQYGTIDPFSRVDSVDFSYFPEIPNLAFKSCLEYCKNDFCRSRRAVLAISCPDEKPLLNWGSRKACEFVTEKCGCYSTPKLQPNMSLKSGKSICDYYINMLGKHYKEYTDVCEHSDKEKNWCQDGRLIAEVWKKGQIHTFIVSDWSLFNDQCGDHTAVSYISVNSSTGKEIKCKDLIRRSDEKKMGDLLLKYVRNQEEGWIEVGAEELIGVYDGKTDSTGIKLFNEMSGCGLLKEGLIIYYHPYTIGYGGNGEFFAIIPYNVLKENGIRLKNL